MMWVWVLNRFKARRCYRGHPARGLHIRMLLIRGALTLLMVTVLALANPVAPGASAKSPSVQGDNSWQIAQVMPRRKPGDEPPPAKKKPAPVRQAEPTPEESLPTENLPREKPAAASQGSDESEGFVWNKKDLAARDKQQAVLGIVIKLLAGGLLALSAAMMFWNMSWRAGAVFLFTLSVWIFEFRSIIGGFDVPWLAYLLRDQVSLALMGVAATGMIHAVLGAQLSQSFRRGFLVGFGGLFLALLVGGFFIAGSLALPTRLATLAGAVAILIILVMTLGRGAGRSFSFGLLLVAISIFVSAISPLLINTGAPADAAVGTVAPAILWLHVTFLVAVFFINIPARLSNAYGENFPLPGGAYVDNGPHFDRAAPSFSTPPSERYSREDEYDEPDYGTDERYSHGDYDDDYEDDYADNDFGADDGYETDRRSSHGAHGSYAQDYEAVDETLEDEDRYALGIAAAHQGIWDWNIEHDELYLSPSVDGMLGLAAGGLIRSEVGWAERVHPDDFDAYRNSLRTYLRRGNVAFDIEFRIRHENGDYIWMQLRATCLPDDEGIAARCIGTLADISQSRSSEDRLQGSTSSDPLTGLMNRSAMNDRINEALAGARGGIQPGLIVIDMDRFKTVNDSLGHNAGDLLLQAVARRLEEAVGRSGDVARLGSDEFAILTNGTGASSRVIADNAMNALADPLELEGYEVFPMASFGLAEATPHHARAEDVLKDAETAMFRAKRTGGGCIEVFESSMAQQSVATLSLETDLRRALERRQMEVLFQPIINFQNDAIAGFEALLRWRHPVQGLLTPDQFVSLAEETDMIVPLGRFVLSMASQQLAHWHRVFPVSPPLFVSVNVSSRQLKRHNFADDVREVLLETGLMPGTLKLEVTESLIMEDPRLAENLLNEIKAIGAGIVLDDFGTGFASLSNLQRYPFDTIKVDRSFISTMDSRPDSHVIVNSIVNLANDLRLTVIAEGLESDDDTYRLRQMGCHFGQGYVFGMPMSAQDAQTFIAHHWHDARGI